MEGLFVIIGIGLAHQYFATTDASIDAQIQTTIPHSIQSESTGNFTATHGDVQWVIITDD